MNLEYQGTQTFAKGWEEQSKNNYDRAISLYNQAIELYNQSPDAIKLKSKVAHAYVNIGICYDLLGNKTQYESYSNLSIKTDPNYPNGYYHLGRCMFDIDNYPKAIYCFEKVVELKYGNPDGYYMLGQSRYLNLLENAPFDLASMLGQIRYLEEMSKAYKEVKEALRILSEGLETYSDYSRRVTNYNFIAAGICIYLGNFTQAKYHLNIAAKLGDEVAKKMLSEL